MRLGWQYLRLRRLVAVDVRLVPVAVTSAAGALGINHTGLARPVARRQNEMGVLLPVVA